MDDKALYRDVGKLIQIEGNFAHVDVEGLSQFRGDNISKTLMTRESGIALFQETVQMNGGYPLKNPEGYMTLDNNVYDYIRDTYEEKYEQAYDAVEGGFAMGTTYALEAVLNDLNRKISHDIRKHIPGNVSYLGLRNVESTPDIERVVDQFVEQRVKLTQAQSIRRSVEESTIYGIQDRMDSIGQAFGVLVHDAIIERNTELDGQMLESNLDELVQSQKSL